MPASALVSLAASVLAAALAFFSEATAFDSAFCAPLYFVRSWFRTRTALFVVVMCTPLSLARLSGVNDLTLRTVGTTMTIWPPVQKVASTALSRQRFTVGRPPRPACRRGEPRG